ncbi:MAG: PKD domain-containing protein [Chlorobi bacterium]|nr:PKD domain-containing protein [Chlorobiota bacterium]
MKQKTLYRILSPVIFFLSMTLFAQQTVNFVTFGKQADPGEGDNDFIQIFFIQTDAAADDSLTVEIFDADCSGKNDMAFNGAFNSEFLFSLYGGKNAFTASTITTENPSQKDLRKGKLLQQLSVNSETGNDNQWTIFARTNKKEGEYFNGSYYFKLIVEGISGDDANVFNLRAVNKKGENLRIFNFAPTIHQLPKSAPAQLRFYSGESAKFTILNFDADGTAVKLITPYRTAAKLTSSGGGVWASADVELFPFEKNEICAVQFNSGRSKPNDAVFIVKNEKEKAVPIELPVTTKIEFIRPVVKYKIVQTEDCNTVSANATSSYHSKNRIVNAKWLLPDGNIAEGLKRKLTFHESGKHKVILAIKDDSGVVECGAYKEFTVFTNNPPKAVAGEDIFIAEGEKLTVRGDRSSDSDGSIVKYEWDFGDGTRRAGKKLSHTFRKHGSYTVKLTVTDNVGGFCGTDSDSFTVMVNAAPVADAGKDIRCAANETILFDGSQSVDPDGNIMSYEWNLGDGSKASGQKITHKYNRPGKYRVTLKVVDDSNQRNNASTDKATVWVNDKPTAKAGKNREIAVGETITLNGNNSFDKDGKIIQFVWSSDGEFEDSSKTAKVSFSRPGKYKVKLRVKDDSGTNSEYDEDEIIITVNAPPVAKAGNDVYQTNGLVKFNAGGSFDPDGKITKYKWNFGDGMKSYSKNPEHLYRNPGEYKVTLTVQDNSPTLNNFSSDEINVRINAKPIADAGPDQTVAPGETFSLSASSSIDPDGAISKFEWSCGNQTIGDGEKINYSFERSGLYNIQLKAADNSGHAEAIDFDNLTIKVNEAPRIITNSFYKIAPGETVNFDASKSFDSDGKIISFEWFSGEKEISAKSRFTHKFTEPGIHRIKLLVSDDANVGNSVSQKEIEVLINASPVIKPIADILTCDNSVSVSAEGTFDPDNDVLDFKWDFGDGAVGFGINAKHKYEKAGTYPVLLTVDDGRNLSNSAVAFEFKVKINSAPIAAAGEDESVCSGDIVTLDASSSFDPDEDLLKYEWDFGDGTTGEGVSVMKDYSLPGIYVVTLKTTDATGLTCNSDVDTKIITVVESPVARAGEDIAGCANGEVIFDASKSTDSDGIVNSFFWDFGDGDTGGGMRTSHIYEKAGTYNVTLTITGEPTPDCDNTDADKLIVTIEEAPSADFDSADSAAVNSEISFDASASDGKEAEIVLYEWDFGDGNKANGKKTAHAYAKAGIYIVNLKIKTSSKSECNSSVVSKSIYVNEAPIAKAEGTKSGSVGQSLRFSAAKSRDPNGQITRYNWNFGDGKTAEGIETEHRFSKAGNYSVKLTVKDNAGLSNGFASDTINVRINKQTTGEIISPNFGFAGKPLPIKLKVNGSADKVFWEIDGEKISSTPEKYIFEKAGKHDVSCAIFDANGTSVQTSKTVAIYPVPQIIFDDAKIYCANKMEEFEIGLEPADLSDKIIIEWRFPNGKILMGDKVKTKFTKSGNRQIEISLKSAGDSEYVLASKAFSVNVNSAPKAKISKIPEAFIGGANDNVLFDASESYDAENDPLTYKWNFGDGNRATGIRVFHTYAKAGSYQITLTVSDNKNCECNKDSTKKTVKIKLR